jgi:3-oxoacyl-[acyl-carrier protein] reductase
VSDAAAAGPVALVTGVRPEGIGLAVAHRLLADGHRVLAHTWPAHDAVIDALGGAGPRLRHVAVDLEDPEAPRRLVDHAVEAFGAVDVLVACHARSSDVGLEAATADELDRCWAVNARAVVLLVQHFARRHDDARPGRVVLFTSGQHLEPMAGELPYAISKGAVHQMTRTLADAVAARGITVNAVNPGPTDTGWPTDELRERLRPAFPAGRWGRPEDIAGVVAWLASSDGAWVTGQVIDAEGGFRRTGG